MDSSVRGVRECRTALNLLDVAMNKILEDILLAKSRQEIEALLAEFRKQFINADNQLEVSLSALIVIGTKNNEYRLLWII